MKQQPFEQQGYIIVKGQSSQLGPFGSWCKRNQQPLIYAELKGKYARAEMDLIFAPRECELNERSQELVRMIFDRVMTPRSDMTNSGSIFNYITHLSPDQAEAVAQAFLAIYRWQNLNAPLQLPEIAAPGPENQRYARLEEAKRKHYLVASGVSDARIRFRWGEMCKTWELPHIVIDARGQRYAKAEVTLPAVHAFTPEMERAIELLGEEVGIRSDRAHRVGGRSGPWPWYIVRDGGVNLFRSTPMADALYFVEGIVRLFDGAGYFHEVPTLEKGL